MTLRRRAGSAVPALAAAALLATACAPHPERLAPAPEAAGVVVLPPDYDSRRAYPVVELLPPTGSTAEAILQIYLAQAGLGALYREPPQRQLEALWPYLFPREGSGPGFLLILARGRGRASDYRTEAAWTGTIERYERRVLADLAAAADHYRIDRSRLVLAGFSLGGDLAWAITLRNPDRLHGAIVMASRASYRPTPDGAGDLDRRGTRFFLTMGSRDIGTRRRMATAAADELQRWGVPHRFEVIPRLGHGPAPLRVFAQALRFVLER